MSVATANHTILSFMAAGIGSHTYGGTILCMSSIVEYSVMIVLHVLGQLILNVYPHSKKASRKGKATKKEKQC